MKRRIEGLDLAKGICILLVIAGHTLASEVPGISKYGEALRMPFFFLISGFFFKQHTDRFILDKNFRRLLLPYIATVLILILRQATKLHSMQAVPSFLYKSFAQLSYGAVLPFGKDKSVFGINVNAVGPVWFLLCLFFANYLFHLLIKIPTYAGRILAILAAMALVVVINRYVYLPLNLDIAVSAVPLLLAGYYFKQIDILHKVVISSANKKAIIIVLIALPLYVVCNNYTTAGIGIRQYYTIVLTYLGGIAGFICLINLSEALVPFKWVNKILTFYGKETLVILCIHSLDLFIRYPQKFYDHPFLFVLWRILVVTAGIYIIKLIPPLKKIYYNLDTVQPKLV